MTINSEYILSLTTDQKAYLEELAISADEKLVSAGQDSANRAFNLGCTAGLIPALLFIGLTLIITKGSWIATAFISGLMVMGLLAFANLSAYISRSRAYKRCYEMEIRPEIDRVLEMNGIDQHAFEVIASEIIIEGAPLREFLEIDENLPSEE